jgi:hypothetical protein
MVLAAMWWASLLTLLAQLGSAMVPDSWVPDTILLAKHHHHGHHHHHHHDGDICESTDWRKKVLKLVAEVPAAGAFFWFVLARTWQADGVAVSCLGRNWTGRHTR